MGKVKNALLEAGSNLSRKELLKISESTGKSVDKILSKAVNNNMTLGSSLVNKYNAGQLNDNRGSQNTYTSILSNSLGKGYSNALGISPAIQQLRSAPKLDSGSVLFIGSKGSTQTVLPKGLSSGGGTKAPAPKSIYDLTKLSPSTEGPRPGGDPAAAAAATDTAPITPPPPPEPPPMFSPGGASDSLGGNATGLRRKKSKARMAGITNQGTGQFKISNSSNFGQLVNTGM